MYLVTLQTYFPGVHWPAEMTNWCLYNDEHRQFMQPPGWCRQREEYNKSLDLGVSVMDARPFEALLSPANVVRAASFKDPDGRMWVPPQCRECKVTELEQGSSKKPRLCFVCYHSGRACNSLLKQNSRNSHDTVVDKRRLTMFKLRLIWAILCPVK